MIDATKRLRYRGKVYRLEAVWPVQRVPGLQAGDLRHHAGLERPVKTPDGAGGFVVTWEPVRMIWCLIRPLSGRMRIEAGALESQVTHEVFARGDGHDQWLQALAIEGVPT